MATSVGTVWVDVRFNTASLGQDLGRVLGAQGAAAGANAGAAAGAALNSSLGASLTRMGTSLGNLGRQVSLGLSLPLIAFGKVAADSFTEFDTAMTQTAALAGESVAQVEDWREEVLDLGEAYGVSGAEAAKGLYFIASSGVDAADAMSVLDTAVEGAAIGLGTTQQVADIATSAMNSYGKENISAAQATDILTVAVREGKGEADDMAGALSRVIPLAASMGVTFGEVSGVMSALTLSGLSADEAATQINALLVSLQKLPNEAQRNMKAYTGLDYATVQNNLKTKGLTETLREIYNAFKGNEDAIGKVFGNTRALRGITGLFGEKENQTRAIVERTTHALGAQDAAMEKTAKSASFQLRQSQEELGNAMTNIGASVVPVVSGATQAFAVLFEAADAFGPVGKNVLVFTGTIAAAAGPLLYMGSSVMRLVGNLASLGKTLDLAVKFADMAGSTNALTRTLGNAGMAAQMFSTTLLGIAGAAAVALTAIKVTQSYIYEYEESFKRLGEEGKEKTGQVESWEELRKRIDLANKGLEETNTELDQLNQERRREGPFAMFDYKLAQRIQANQEAGRAYEAMGADAAKAAEQVQAIAAATGLNLDSATQWVMGQRALGQTFNTTEEALKAYNKALAENDPSVRKAIDTTEAAKNSWEGIIATVKETSDAFFAVQSAQKAYGAAQQRIVDAQKAVTAAEKAHRDALADVANAQRKATQADQAAEESTRRLADAKQAAIDAQNALNAALAGPSEEEQLDVRSARLALREAQEAVRKPGLTPLERERAQITLARARIDLRRAEAAHDERIVDLRKEVADATDGVRSAEQAQADAFAAQADARQAVLDAQAKTRDTLNEITIAQWGVTQAQQDAVGPAMALEQAQADLNVMFSTGTIEADKFRGYLVRLKELYPELGAALDDYIGKFDKWGAEHPREGGPPPPPVPAEPPPPPPSPVTPEQSTYFRERLLNRNKRSYYQWIPGRGYQLVTRAAGGPVAAGQMAQVNERGAPELWSQGGKQWLLPTVAGRVEPQPVDASRNVGDIIVQGAPTPVQTAYEIRRQIRAKGI